MEIVHECGPEIFIVELEKEKLQNEYGTEHIGFYSPFVEKGISQLNPDLLSKWDDKKKELVESTERAMKELFEFIESTDGDLRLEGLTLYDVRLDGRNFVGRKLDLMRFVHVHFDGANFERCRMSSCVFAACRMEDAHLENAYFTGCNFGCHSFVDCGLKLASFHSCWLNFTFFNNASAVEATFSETQAKNASFVGANLEKADFVYVDCCETKFESARLQGAKFRNADLRKADFRKAHLENAFFWEAKLRATQFHFALLQGASFHSATLGEGNLDESVSFLGAELQGAIFDHSVLPKAIFYNTNLQNASFRYADLCGARFGAASNETFARAVDLERKSKLQEAIFDGAKLGEANFDGVDLQNASFKDADLCRASFKAANLQGTIFDGANLDGAIFSDETKFDKLLPPRKLQPRVASRGLGVCRRMAMVVAADFSEEIEDSAWDELPSVVTDITGGLNPEDFFVDSIVRDLDSLLKKVEEMKELVAEALKTWKDENRKCAEVFREEVRKLTKPQMDATCWKLHYANFFHQRLHSLEDAVAKKVSQKMAPAKRFPRALSNKIHPETLRETANRPDSPADCDQMGMDKIRSSISSTHSRAADMDNIRSAAGIIRELADELQDICGTFQEDEDEDDSAFVCLKDQSCKQATKALDELCCKSPHDTILVSTVKPLAWHIDRIGQIHDRGTLQEKLANLENLYSDLLLKIPPETSFEKPNHPDSSVKDGDNSAESSEMPHALQHRDENRHAPQRRASEMDKLRSAAETIMEAIPLFAEMLNQASSIKNSVGFQGDDEKGDSSGKNSVGFQGDDEDDIDAACIKGHPGYKKAKEALDELCCNPYDASMASLVKPLARVVDRIGSMRLSERSTFNAQVEKLKYQCTAIIKLVADCAVVTQSADEIGIATTMKSAAREILYTRCLPWVDHMVENLASKCNALCGHAGNAVPFIFMQLELQLQSLHEELDRVCSDDEEISAALFSAAASSCCKKLRSSKVNHTFSSLLYKISTSGKFETKLREGLLDRLLTRMEKTQKLLLQQALTWDTDYIMANPTGSMMQWIRNLISMAYLILFTSSRQLRVHENELAYLRERLQAIESKSPTSMEWLEYAQAFEALIRLMHSISSTRGQAVLHCLVEDEAAMQATATALQLKNASTKNDPPAVLVRALKRGPCNHILSNAWQYRRAIDAEFAMIGTILQYQQRLFASVGSLIVVLLIGVANFAARYLYDRFELSPSES